MIRLFWRNIYRTLKSFTQKYFYFFFVVKNFPQEIENTREIIENMSEIF